MKMEQNLDSLKRIKPVDAPPFLFTRIQARIESLDYVPVQWKWGFAAAALIVLAMNLGVVLQSTGSDQRAGVQDVVSAMHLTTSNSLYNE